MSAMKELTKGIYIENPIFRIVLGMCPTLAVSTSVNNALGMGAAATFVLVCSNVIISMLRKGTPAKIRIPIFIVVIAAFVTLVEMVMQAYMPALFKALGIFVPLIVVNCIILGRAEAFACRNGVYLSLLDGIGMGLGFTLALTIIAVIREVFGNGTFSGIPVMGTSYEPMLLLIIAPGGFVIMGFLLALSNYIDMKTKKSSD